MSRLNFITELIPGILFAGIGLFVEGLLNICVSLCTVKIVKNQYPDVIEGDYEVEE